MDNKLGADLVIVNRSEPLHDQIPGEVALFNEDLTPFSTASPSVTIKEHLGMWDAETAYEPNDMVSFSCVYGILLAEAVEASTGEAPFTYVDGEEDIMSMFSDKWRTWFGPQDVSPPPFIYQPGVIDPRMYGDTWRLYQGDGTATSGTVTFSLTPTYLGEPQPEDAWTFTFPYNFTIADVWDSLRAVDLDKPPAFIFDVREVVDEFTSNLIPGAVDIRWRGYYATVYGAEWEFVEDTLVWEGTEGTPSVAQTDELFTGVGMAIGAVFFGDIPYVCCLTAQSADWMPLIPSDRERSAEDFTPETFIVSPPRELGVTLSIGYSRVPDSMSQGGSFIIEVAMDTDFNTVIAAMAYPATSMSPANTMTPGPSMYASYMAPATVGYPVYIRARAINCYGFGSQWINLTSTGDGQGAPLQVTMQPLNGNTHVSFDGTTYGGTATTLAEALAEIAAAAGITPP